MEPLKKFPEVEISNNEIVEQVELWHDAVVTAWECYEQSMPLGDDERTSGHWADYGIASDEYDKWMREGMKRGIV